MADSSKAADRCQWSLEVNERAGSHRVKLNVAVIGAGVGGSGVAVALLKAGHNVTLYERDVSRDARAQGYSLTIQQGARILEALGVMDQVRNEPNRIQTHQLFDAEGRTLAIFGKAVIDASQPPQSRKGNIPIPREKLRSLLIDRVPSDCVQWGQELTEWDADETGVTLTFRDHLGDDAEASVTIRADLAIACEGINSRVRKRLVGDDPRYSGCLMINGIVEADHPLCTDRVFQTLDGFTRVFHKPFDAGTSMWQLTYPAPIEDFAVDLPDLEAAKAKAVALTAGWHAPVPDMIEATPVELMRAGILCDLEPITEPWPTGRMTLLGDSAHAMTPFKGQGANNALEDIGALTRQLDEHLDALGDGFEGDASDPRVHEALIAALAAFETECRLRSASPVLKSRANVDFYHTGDAVVQERVFEHMGWSNQIQRVEAAIASAKAADDILNLVVAPTDGGDGGDDSGGG